MPSAETPEATAAPRRKFLNKLLSIGALGVLTCVIYPVIRFLTPLRERGANGPVPVTADKMPGIVQQPHFEILRAGTTRLIVFQDALEEVRALSAVCTHEGCTVQFLDADQIIWCACHNGKFDLDGRVLSGPPPRPLARYPVEKAEDGALRVSLDALPDAHRGRS